MAEVMAELDFPALWREALPYERFVEESKKNESLWRGVYKTTPIPDWAFKLACQRGRNVRLLVIAEDWCGDASNTVPVLAKLGAEAACLDMRVIRRDENPEVMDRYLTNGSRSIPIVIVLNAEFHELGHWGPRPSELQEWVMENKGMPSNERYPKIRRWYAKDKGAATMREVLELLGGEGRREK